jgi:hypothetical protein
MTGPYWSSNSTNDQYRLVIAVPVIEKVVHGDQSLPVIERVPLNNWYRSVIKKEGSQ